jgi:hypothetical protein
MVTPLAHLTDDQIIIRMVNARRRSEAKELRALRSELARRAAKRRNV